MASKSGKKLTQFQIEGQPGSNVCVVGSFNGWEEGADPLRDEAGTGVYTRAMALPDGEHQFKYVVDGDWILDRSAPWRSNGQGSYNSVLPRSGDVPLSPGRLKASLREDPYLAPYRDAIERRAEHTVWLEERLTGGKISLADLASGHEYYGLHRKKKKWIFREWAPHASAITFYGDFCDWDPENGIALKRINEKGDWEAEIPRENLQHGQLYRLRVQWPGGEGDRLPSHARRVVQDEQTKVFSAQAWAPARAYRWRHKPVPSQGPLLIYEAHVGIAQEEGKVGTYTEFARNILPRIARAGYNAIQLMAIIEHPYYGSFGYHVTNFFAASSRFGTPEELKALVDAAHKAGLLVIIDIVHSHAAKNELEGLSRFDGTPFQYFHAGSRGNHDAWDSRCFDYGKPEVLHFLLSNCRYWLDEFRVDGFRFDGVTSMLYHHHGLGSDFDHYGRYFDDSVDEDAYTYLALANKLIHEIKPDALTIAEDVSGMPGLGADTAEGGCGFDFRMSMGVPDHWFRLCDIRDEDWNVDQLWDVLTGGREDERRISYVESHDQALVGGKSFIFQLVDAAMYDSMSTTAKNLMVDRGVALHKMARLATAATADGGYLNFMGNEFGHPEWVDFPREGNDWSYHYARRQWSLRDNPQLRYHGLGEFDQAALEILSASGALNRPCLLQSSHVADQVLAFSRGNLLIVLNFHPTQSLTDYSIPAQNGTYQLVLDSDATRFSGHGRVDSEVSHCAMDGRIRLYLPNRTALVLARTEEPAS